MTDPRIPKVLSQQSAPKSVDYDDAYYDDGAPSIWTFIGAGLLTATCIMLCAGVFFGLIWYWDLPIPGINTNFR